MNCFRIVFLICGLAVQVSAATITADQFVGGGAGLTGISGGSSGPFTNTIISRGDANATNGAITTPLYDLIVSNANGTVFMSNGNVKAVKFYGDISGGTGLTAGQIPDLSATYPPVGRTITIAGTANQITSSAGAQDLSANRTWTLSLPYNLGNVSSSNAPLTGSGIAGVVQTNASTIVWSESGPIALIIVSNVIVTNYIIINKNGALQSTNALEVWDKTNTVNPVFAVNNTNTSGAGINSVRIGGNKLIEGFGGAAGTTSEFDVSTAGALTAKSVTSGGNVTLANAGLLLFGNRGAFDSTFNGAARCLNQNLDRIGSLQAGVTNQTKTANYTVVTLESGIDFNDSGASSAHTNTLPASIPGTHLFFTCLVAQTFDVKAAIAQDTIRYGGTVSAGGGDIFTSSIGSTLHVKCPVTNVWIIDQLVGTWTVPQ